LYYDARIHERHAQSSVYMWQNILYHSICFMWTNIWLHILNHQKVTGRYGLNVLGLGIIKLIFISVHG